MMAHIKDTIMAFLMMPNLSLVHVWFTYHIPSLDHGTNMESCRSLAKRFMYILRTGVSMDGKAASCGWKMVLVKHVRREDSFHLVSLKHDDMVIHVRTSLLSKIRREDVNILNS